MRDLFSDLAADDLAEIVDVVETNRPERKATVELFASTAALSRLLSRIAPLLARGWNVTVLGKLDDE